MNAVIEKEKTSLIRRAKAFRTQKSLGQCFLVDANVLDKIVKVSELEDEILIEIGAGIGFLTERMLGKAKHLFAIELDPHTESFHRIFKANHSNYSFIRGDCLKLNIEELLKEHGLLEMNTGEAEPKKNKPRVKIVANLPYQITSKILIHLLGEIGEPSENAKYISEINILVQKEFAEKLIAKPGTKPYSSMTLLVQHFGEVEKCFDLSSSCFYPRPKVDSSFIKIKPHGKKCFGEESNLDPIKAKQTRRLIKAIFSNRRKILSNALVAAGYEKELVKSMDLGNLRGETLSLEEISSFASKLGKNT